MPPELPPFATDAPPPDGGLNALILDDERFDRHRIARLCSGLPMPCVITNAVTLEEFASRLDTGVYDLIIVDYFLPDGTGMEALEAVRCSAQNFKSATIMVTGQANSDVADAALRGGCADYLTKDELTPATFQRAVTNALQKSALSLEVELQSFARAEVEVVLELFASRFAGDIKPMVSRTLRQVRDLRAAPDATRIEAVSQSCMAIWEALVELERHTGVEMMAQTMQKSPGLAPARPRKPPSPFARTRH